MAPRSTGKRAAAKSGLGRNSPRGRRKPSEVIEERPPRPKFVPKKSLGQHFLSDANILRRIVASAGLSGDEVVIEVGPGPGSLTDLLLHASQHLIAIELDDEMSASLLQRYRNRPDFTLIHTDVLAEEPEVYLEQAGVSLDQPYVVVANLPYNIGAAVLRHFLEAEHQPSRLVVMLQREVAASVTAAQGDMGLLAVATRVYAEPRRLFNVPPGAFTPPPRVMSTVLRLDVRPEPLVPFEEIEHFFDIVRAGFNAPRKQLRNTLAQGLQLPPEAVLPAIEAASIDPSSRPETLTVDDWLRLCRSLKAG